MSAVVRRPFVAAAVAACALPCIGSETPRPTLSRLQVDRGFGIGGYARPALKGPREFREVACDPSGRIVVAGSTKRTRERNDTYEVVRVVRFLPDGRLDRTFGKRGVSSVPIEGTVNELLVDGSDRILLVGALSAAGGAPGGVLRLAADGSLDPGFSGDGTFDFTGDPRRQEWLAAGLDPSDGSLAAVARDASGDDVVVRLGADGAPVPGFGDAGTATLPGRLGFLPSVAIDGSGGVVASLDRSCVRFTAEGTLDTRLDPEGLLRRPDGGLVSGQALRDEQGRIVVLRRLSDFGGPIECHRFRAGGSPDPSFGVLGGATVLSGVPADGAAESVVAVSPGGADRWLVAGRVVYSRPNGAFTGFGFFVQSIDPSAPDAVAALASRFAWPAGRGPSFVPDAVVDAAVALDGTAAYLVGERRRGSRPGFSPQLFRVDLAPAEPVALPEIRVEWALRPELRARGDEHDVRSRVRVVNSGPGRCHGGVLDVLLSDDAELDPADRYVVRWIEFPRIDAGAELEFPVHFSDPILRDEDPTGKWLVVRVATPFDCDPANDFAVSPLLE